MNNKRAISVQYQVLEEMIPPGDGKNTVALELIDLFAEKMRGIIEEAGEEELTAHDLRWRLGESIHQDPQMVALEVDVVRQALLVVNGSLTIETLDAAVQAFGMAVYQVLAEDPGRSMPIDEILYKLGTKIQANPRERLKAFAVNRESSTGK